MSDARAKGENTRQINIARRAAADAEAAEYRARILAMLLAVSEDPTATIGDKLRAAEIAVELKRRC